MELKQTYTILINLWPEGCGFDSRWGHWIFQIYLMIPDEVIGFFNFRNPSSRTTVLGSTQPLTEMSTRNLPGA
jgi:hypothetical protein